MRLIPALIVGLLLNHSITSLMASEEISLKRHEYCSEKQANECAPVAQETQRSEAPDLGKTLLKAISENEDVRKASREALEKIRSKQENRG